MSKCAGKGHTMFSRAGATEVTATHTQESTNLDYALTQSQDARDAAKGHFNLARLAETRRIPLHEITESIQEAIDLAWAHPTPAQQLFQSQHFPNGKPSPALFVGRIAGLV